MSWAGPSTHVRPAWTHRSASPYQVNIHSTATTRAWRYGAIALRKISGVVGLWQWSRIAPSRLKIQTVHRSGMQVDATVRLMYFGGASHWTSSSSPTAVGVASIPHGEVMEVGMFLLQAHAGPEVREP